MAGGGIVLQSAATTGNGNAAHCFGFGGEYLFEIVPSGTVSGGSIQFEEAPSSGYAATWRAIDAAITPATDTYRTLRVSGSYKYVRARIASDVTGGGTVTCKVTPPLFGGE